jgi:hypothetical protein
MPPLFGFRRDMENEVTGFAFILRREVEIEQGRMRRRYLRDVTVTQNVEGVGPIDGNQKTGYFVRSS